MKCLHMYQEESSELPNHHLKTSVLAPLQYPLLPPSAPPQLFPGLC